MSQEKIFKVFILERAEHQLLVYLLYVSVSIECKQNKTKHQTIKYGYSISTSVINTLQQLRIFFHASRRNIAEN